MYIQISACKYSNCDYFGFSWYIHSLSCLHLTSQLCYTFVQNAFSYAHLTPPHRAAGFQYKPFRFIFQFYLKLIAKLTSILIIPDFQLFFIHDIRNFMCYLHHVKISSSLFRGLLKVFFFLSTRIILKTNVCVNYTLRSFMLSIVLCNRYSSDCSFFFKPLFPHINDFVSFFKLTPHIVKNAVGRQYFFLGLDLEVICYYLYLPITPFKSQPIFIYLLYCNAHI